MQNIPPIPGNRSDAREAKIQQEKLAEKFGNGLAVHWQLNRI